MTVPIGSGAERDCLRSEVLINWAKDKAIVYVGA